MQKWAQTAGVCLLLNCCGMYASVTEENRCQVRLLQQATS